MFMICKIIVTDMLQYTTIKFYNPLIGYFSLDNLRFKMDKIENNYK